MNIRASWIFFLMTILDFSCFSFAYAENEETLTHWFAGIGTEIISPIINHKTNYANSGMPGFPNDKYVTNDWTQLSLISFIAGYQWQFPSNWLNALNLSLEYNYSHPKLKGDIYVNSLEDAKNFRYQYDVKQQLIQFKLKFNIFRWYEFMPYFSLGAGIAVNDLDNYSESAIPGATVFGRRYEFTSDKTTQFASSIGIGTDFWFHDKMALNVGYIYTTTGNVQTGYGQGVLSGDRLKNKLSSHSLLLQVLYFF